jgi:hypothetical protein
MRLYRPACEPRGWWCPMTHPCAAHMASCDHCYRCDVLGECCQTSLPGVAVHPPVVVVQRDVLHDAVIEDSRRATPSLSQLVRAEGIRPRLAGLLLPGPPVESNPNDSRKEAVYVLAARTTE